MKISEQLADVIQRMQESDARMQQLLDSYVQRTGRLLKELENNSDEQLE